MIADLVRAFLSREFFRGQTVDAIKLDQPLVSSGILDSIATLKLVLFLEDTFHVAIESTDIVNGHLDNLASIEALIRSKQQTKTNH